MSDERHSAFKSIITQFQQETTTLRTVEEQEQFASLSSVLSQISLQSFDDTSSATRKEDSLTMEAVSSCFKKAACSCGEDERGSGVGLTEENPEPGQELLGSIDDKVTDCDLVSGLSGWEEKSVVCEKKVKAFAVEVEESGNSEAGCVADSEKSLKDSVKLEVGSSGIQECNKFNEKEESEDGVEMLSEISGYEGNGVVFDGNVQASVEVEETENSEVDCVADFETTWKDSGKLEVDFPGAQECDNEEKGPEVKVEMSSVVEGDNEDGKEKKSEALLEAKKKQLLAELEVSCLASQEVHKLVQNNGVKIDGARVSDVSVRSSLKIEVVDDTALIESVRVPKMIERNMKKGEKEQEVDGKTSRRSRRKAKDVKKALEMSEKFNNLTGNLDNQNGGLKNGRQGKIMYSRKEMEVLRFVSIVEQRKMWKDIYTGLGPVVMTEYDDLASSKHQKQILLNFDPGQNLSRKPEAHGILGEEGSPYVDNDLENTDEYDANGDNMNPVCNTSTEREASYMVQQGECSEDYDSDEDYSSIQRPAFFVEGEPDFDSGPPEDGLEYLRHVRWEAAHIPKVKVAKRDWNKPSKEQSVYMPQIPDIPQCPEHLIPLKEWEDSFLADFSNLRQVLSGILNPGSQLAGKLQEMIVFQKENESCQLSENTVDKTDELSGQPVDSFSDEITAVESSILKSEEDEIDLCHQNPKTSQSGDSSNRPTLSAILKMDSVARVSMLRKRITSVETLSVLSWTDCVWLYSLCAAVDTPLDADTAAALRSLLRKCASLRAGKSELDDEVVMLNILATISGRYFGQAED